MDLDLIQSLSFAGNTLNPQEKALLNVAMVKKASAEKDLTSVQFWGKITGTEGRYYLICVGLQDRFAGIPAKKFFYIAIDSKPDAKKPRPVLADLSPCPSQFEAECKKQASKALSGNPAEVLEDAEEPDEEDETAQYREEFRLSYIVRQIDSTVSIVPRGAYIVTPSHRVLRNPTYEGLSNSEAKSLKNFFHFREPVQLKAIGALERKGLIKSTDFLDAIASDLPKGCWAHKSDARRSYVSLSSLLFPGYHFFHKLGSPAYGGAYFGNGLMNKDLVFMI